MRDFDIVIYGATGFTGRLVAEYLVQTYPTGLTWAMAGRSRAKLEEVRDLIGARADTPLITADSDDPASLRAMVGRATVVIGVHYEFCSASQGFVGTRIHVADDHVGLEAGLDQRIGASIDTHQ